MDLLFWGITFGFVGKVLLGITVIRVHARIVKEQHIDEAVLKEMKSERLLAIGAVILIIIGYLFEITYFEYLPFF
ncbi:hypothetical protein IIC45_01685 [Patescibacteria group bacterium]|nr:hypothetical protein [Patescibacteria group bacterium]